MATPDRFTAYEAWHAAKRALDDAMPWTPDWLRLRMIEQELRTAYEEHLTEGSDSEHEEVAPRTDAPAGKASDDGLFRRERAS